jgi:hypothetical protein
MSCSLDGKVVTVVVEYDVSVVPPCTIAVVLDSQPDGRRPVGWEDDGGDLTKSGRRSSGGTINWEFDRDRLDRTVGGDSKFHRHTGHRELRKNHRLK